MGVCAGAIRGDQGWSGVSEQESVGNKVIAVVSNSSRPFGDCQSGCWQCINVAFVSPMRSSPHQNSTSRSPADDDEVVPASCQQSTLDASKTEPKTRTACQLWPARSHVSSTSTSTFQLRPERNLWRMRLWPKRSSPYHRVIFGTWDSCQRFANSLCRFRPQMRHENVENNLLNATSSICQCGSDPSIKNSTGDRST